MLGLTYISVPFYQLFCQLYGIGGTMKKIEQNYDINNVQIMKKPLIINFKAENSSNLP
jgi:cytochrome c oxidase assembly protein Cox11